MKGENPKVRIERKIDIYAFKFKQYILRYFYVGLLFSEKMATRPIHFLASQETNGCAQK